MLDAPVDAPTQVTRMIGLEVEWFRDGVMGRGSVPSRQPVPVAQRIARENLLSETGWD